MHSFVPYLNWNYSVYWSEDYGGTIKMPTGLMPAPGILTYRRIRWTRPIRSSRCRRRSWQRGPTMALHARGLKAAEAYSGKGYKPWQFIYEPFVIGSFWVSPENMLMWCFQEPGSCTAS